LPTIDEDPVTEVAEANLVELAANGSLIEVIDHRPMRTAAEEELEPDQSHGLGDRNLRALVYVPSGDPVLLDRREAISLLDRLASCTGLQGYL
jgi:hypothetical protein